MGKYIDANQKKFIQNLDEAVAIKSVSAWPETRPEIFKMVKWVAAKIEKLGGSTELKDVGKQTMHDGSVLDLPPVLFGTLGNDAGKKTIMLYGHLDVQPALMVDCLVEDLPTTKDPCWDGCMPSKHSNRQVLIY